MGNNDDIHRSAIGGDYNPTTWEGHVTKSFNDKFRQTSGLVTGSGYRYRKTKTPEQKEASFKWSMAGLTAIFAVVYLQSQGVFPETESAGNSYLIAVGVTAIFIVLIVRYVPYVAKILGFAFLATIAFMIYQCSVAP
jgi:hypothetical protein